MGRRGPLPMSRALHIARGTDRRDRRQPAPATRRPTKGIPRAPKYLTAVAAAEWRRVAKQLHADGRLAPEDHAHLAAYCEAFATWLEARRVIVEKGTTYTTSNGSIVKRPELAIADKAERSMRQSTAALERAAAARARLPAPEERSKAVEQLRKRFFGGRKETQ